ncbi:MAG: site-specific recombinase [Betaproteobacteria bacterium]|nr:site-specific recombinase [Betaproteobacteria bacterium]
MAFAWNPLKLFRRISPELARKKRLEALLARIAAEPAADHVSLWIALVNTVRPSRAHRADDAAVALSEFTQMLAQAPDSRLVLRAALLKLFVDHKQTSLYVSSGLLPSTGFFTETARRISHRLLPDVVAPAYLKDLLTVIFHRKDDEIWVEAIPDEVWVNFFRALLGDEKAADPPRTVETLPIALTEMLEALRILSYHVSAIGLDPELVRIDPQLEELESPFLAQNTEVVAYLEAYRTWWNNPETPLGDEAHLGVMLDQCQEVLQRLRRRASRLGTSLTLTFTLERLRQHLDRIHDLLELLHELHQTRTVASLLPQAVSLFKQTLYAEGRRNRLSDYWSTNVRLLSLRMTDSASKRGEKYITTSRREYFGMLFSAALGGLIIAIMSAFKIMIGALHLAPLTEALCFCLNYGIGFALIHVVGGTVATKQPAMTANAIAASIGETRGKTRDLDNLAAVVVRTLRSQLAAIVGNLGLSIPMSILFSLAFLHLTKAPFIDTIKADLLFTSVAPLSGAPFFAAIAGVCLFLSGLIAAYYDNLTAYNRIPERLAQLRWPRRLFGERLVQRFTTYVENNLGALAGNFFFGFLLGGTTALGVLFGLPLDIRHIAFSAAFVGYASAAYDFVIPLSLIGVTAAGVLLIGLVNLLVSFSLALYVAMRSRGITFAQGRVLSTLVLRHFFSHPLDFFFPPRSAEASPPSHEQGAAHPGNGSSPDAGQPPSNSDHVN